MYICIHILPLLCLPTAPKTPFSLSVYIIYIYNSQVGKLTLKIRFCIYEGSFVIYIPLPCESYMTFIGLARKFNDKHFTIHTNSEVFVLGFK